MNMSTRDRIVQFLHNASVQFEEYHHSPSATSAESAAARAAAGAGDTIGAKALLVKTKKGEFSVCTIPGNKKLDSKKVRKLIGKHGFATGTEMELVTGGLKPGHMPPFGPQLFPEISSLLVDPIIYELDRIGFNAGDPEVSIVMAGSSYHDACGDSSIVSSITVDE